MPFYSLPNPADDESFTSWINRCELRLSPRRVPFIDTITTYDSNSDRFPILDPDFSIEILTSTMVSEILTVGPQTLFRLFRSRSTWVVPSSVWQNACINCLIDSLKNQRCYVFLKSWRYVTRPICPIHQCLLKALPHHQRVSINALTEVHFSTNKCFLKSLQIRKLVVLALKMQRYMTRLENDTSPCALKSFAAHRFLMELFMSSGELRGLACSLFSKPTKARGALTHSGGRVLMLLGAFTSSPFERMCAMILTGYVTGLYSPQENLIFESICNKFGAVFRCNAFAVGELSNVFAKEESRAILRRLETLHFIFPSQNYQHFITGFKDA